MYAGSLDGHEAMHTDSHAPHSLVICSSKGGSGTSQARLPTHTWTSSGQLRHLAVTAWYSTYPPQVQYSLVARIPDHGVCMCHGCQWARGVCTVRGHWVSVTANVVCMLKYTVRTSMPFMGRYVNRSQQLRTKEGVHTYVRKSALLCTIILLETHLTDNRVTVFAAKMSWLFALFLCESSLQARETT